MPSIQVLDISSGTRYLIDLIPLSDGNYALATAGNVYTGAITSVSGTSPLVANTDTSWTFSSQVRHIFIQNNSTQPLYIDFDVASSAGAVAVYPNGGIFAADIPCTVVHIQSPGTPTINSTTSGGIVVRGWG